MPLADLVRAAFVFGSAARGELHASSDIDLLVVGEASFGDVITAIQAAERRLGRDVNPTVYSADEFRAKVLAKHHFLTTVLTEPKMLIVGGDAALIELAGTGSAAPEPNPSRQSPRAAPRLRARSPRQRK
jgi:predicted nucleotidyltransferase